MGKHSRVFWCFGASYPQYIRELFPFPDVSKNFFPLRGIQLVHTAGCRHNADKYKPRIVCRTVVIDTEYEIKLFAHKRHPISRPWGRAMVCLLWEYLEKTDHREQKQSLQIAGDQTLDHHIIDGPVYCHIIDVLGLRQPIDLICHIRIHFHDITCNKLS